MLLIHISGDVIGVGFRATTRRLATKLHLTGYVRNLPNGTVEIGLDDEKSQADKLIAELKTADFTRIDHVSIEKHPGSSGAHSFEIR